MKKNKLILAILVIVLFGTATAGFSYLTMKGRAPEAGIEKELKSAGAIKDGYLAVGDAESGVGVILYPELKVDYLAYGPLAEKIAATGSLCAVVEVTNGIATMDYKAAADVMEAYPEITVWIVGGHGLGGQAAAKFAGRNADAVSGLVLLAAYSKTDLTASGLPVLSLYGSLDTSLDRAEYDKYADNLPADTAMTVIEGGNHAQFGSYGGMHARDTKAELSQDRQQEETAQAIAGLISGEAKG
jgi:hypothetical protein